MVEDTERDEEQLTIDPPKAAAPTAARRPENRPDFEALQERVNKRYGAFGQRPEPEDFDVARVLTDNGARATGKLIAGVFVASLLLSFMSHPTFAGGDWANTFRLDTAFAVVWGPILYWAMAQQRLWKSVRTYLVLALFIESFSESMLLDKGGGYWDSVLWPASVAFFGTLKEFSGLPGASLPVFFFATVGLLWRAVWGKKGPDWVKPPRFARDALLLFLGGVLFLAAYGIARGGQVDWTFRQIIHILQLPIVALLFLYALRIPKDLAAVGTAFVITACVRSLIVLYVYVGVCMPKGITALTGKPEWCTTHSDSVLFVSALVILFAHALEQRKALVTRNAILAGAVIFVGIVLNNRRLAFVSLALAMLVIYLALDPSKRKRRVTTALAIALPLLIGYVLVGSESHSASPLLKPAKAIVSVLDQRDTSSISRDIENENLIYTLRQSPLLTQGFGHEYLSSPNNPPVDLTDVFKNYRIIAHNGVLWLWSIAGVVGFTLLWLIYPLAGTLAVKAYRGAETSIERSAALASFGCVAVCAIQVWGDQGFSSYMTLVTFGVAFAVAARLAVAPTIVPRVD
jgi:hypothetical protein